MATLRAIKGDEMKTKNYGILNGDGNVVVLHTASGEAVTRIDANVYPVGSDLSARYEHPAGIILTVPDANKIGLSYE